MILVTGATGFIGRSVGAFLDQEGRDWRPYGGRINSPQALRAELEGVETVIHLAGAEARGRPRHLQHVDVEGTQRLIEEARRAGVRRLIYPSRLNADPHSVQPLLRAKGEVERLIQRSGLAYTILRTSTLFGRDDRFSEMLVGLAMWTPPFALAPGGGKMPVQPLWVEDFARCVVTTLDRPGMVNQIVTIAGAERLSYRETLIACLDMRGLRRFILPAPMVLVRPLAAITTGWWYWPAVSRFAVGRLFAPDITDLDTVPRQFGFQPARFRTTITYLNRSGMWLRPFRH